MTDLEKIAYAKSFIDKMANGINPLDDTPVPESDLINQIRISRCFFYVSEILRQVIENGGIAPVRTLRNSEKVPFAITEEQLKNFNFSEIPVTLSEITRRINALIDENTMKKLPSTAISGWLLQIEVLEEQEQNGKTAKRPTEKGVQLGISLEHREGGHGPYVAVVFGRTAQEFLVDNFSAILQYKEDLDQQKADKRKGLVR